MAFSRTPQPFPLSRQNIQTSNPFLYRNPAETIPHHNAYTTLPPSYYNGHYPILNSQVSQLNPSVCGSSYPCNKSYLNTRIGNQTVEQLLMRNKSISSQYNNYPFYDPLDPSTMWTAPNQYYNSRG